MSETLHQPHEPVSHSGAGHCPMSVTFVAVQPQSSSNLHLSEKKPSHQTQVPTPGIVGHVRHPLHEVRSSHIVMNCACATCMMHTRATLLTHVIYNNGLTVAIFNLRSFQET